MVSARRAPSVGEITAVRIEAPHSNFDFIDNYLRARNLQFDCPSLRRLFSLARELGAVYLLVETVKPSGSVADEVEALSGHLPNYTLDDLTRLSFWSLDRAASGIKVDEILKTGILLGYALIKVDGWYGTAEGVRLSRCHIFEAIFEKYPHKHNCIAFPRVFDVIIAEKEFALSGVLYCQQGPAIKSCAHVALRSLVMTLGKEKDLFYSEINKVAGVVLQPGESSPGLSGGQIVKVLRYFGLECTSIEYPKCWDSARAAAMELLLTEIEGCEGDVEGSVMENRLRIAIESELESMSRNVLPGELSLPKEKLNWLLQPLDLDGATQERLFKKLGEIRFPLSDLDKPRWTRKVQNEHPYAKFLYAGIEAGGGALLGFELNSPEEEAFNFHIVPVYGHTFNQDTWVPRAESSYFRMGTETRFISSHSWLSSFLMHDDNFGANYCVPKNYLEANQVRFLVAIQREGVLYDGVFAEGMAIDTLHSILGDSLLTSSDHTWMKRLWRGIGTGEVILRSLSLSREEYAQHLESVSDWTGNYEDPVCVNTVRNYLPSMLWVVEFSIPELFPANLRKLGEVVLDAGIPREKLNLKYFIREGVCRLVRFPAHYLMFSDESPGECFFESPSAIDSHVPLYQYCEGT